MKDRNRSERTTKIKRDKGGTLKCSRCGKVFYDMVKHRRLSEEKKGMIEKYTKMRWDKNDSEGAGSPSVNGELLI
ncbi:MAG: hypothetical protein GXO39_09325 [Thermotogae bacterium]|nr:hypothetical protein [Thermotogota bacterium]